MSAPEPHPATPPATPPAAVPSASVPDPRRLAVPAPALPPPSAAAAGPPSPKPGSAPWDASWRLLAPGFGVLVACLLAGEGIKRALGLILPGNILGLFLLLGLLAAGIVRLEWVEAAARWLLWLLPLLFTPVFVLALRDHAFLLEQGRALFGAVAVGVFLSWISTGRLAQWLLARAAPAGEEPAPTEGRSP